MSNNPPRLIGLNDLPDNKLLISNWHKLSFHRDHRKIFPLLDHYRFACNKFGVHHANKFKPGIPPCISKNLLSLHVPKSQTKILSYLYSNSYYHFQWKMRVCEVGYGLLHSSTNLSKMTIYRAFDRFRKGRYIRLIWRGRPEPDDPRYLHSCYELPSTMNQIHYWRINFKNINQKGKLS